MAIKIFKPTTPSRRGMTGYTFDEITKDTPERSLIILRKAHAGRNNYGRIFRHQGGGHRQYIQIVDFKRKKLDIPVKVSAIEYDPNRTARLALLVYADGVKTLHLSPRLELKVGDTASLPARRPEIRPGNCLPLSHIPVGTLVHALELAAKARAAQLVPFCGQLRRSLLGKEVRLRSECACLRVKCA